MIPFQSLKLCCDISAACCGSLGVCWPTLPRAWLGFVLRPPRNLYPQHTPRGGRGHVVLVGGWPGLVCFCQGKEERAPGNIIPLPGTQDRIRGALWSRHPHQTLGRHRHPRSGLVARGAGVCTRKPWRFLSKSENIILQEKLQLQSLTHTVDSLRYKRQLVSPQAQQRDCFTD